MIKKNDGELNITLKNFQIDELNYIRNKLREKYAVSIDLDKMVEIAVEFYINQMDILYHQRRVSRNDNMLNLK